jgi:hypothetical protein
MVDSIQPRPLLSVDLLLVAKGIQQVRLRLEKMIAEGQVPEDCFEDVTSVLVLGFDLAESLRRLAK